MRGKALFQLLHCFYNRITPAYAGKSTEQPGDHTANRDHPRLCGEKLCDGLLQNLPQGSPPPMRGKVFTI